MLRILIALTMILMVSASAAYAETARAAISGTTGTSTVNGIAKFKDTEKGLEVDVAVSGVTPGAHGIHIHEKGDCSDGANAAGGHYNPDQVKHGHFPKDGPSGAHPGDLGNIEVDAQGEGSLTAVLPGVTLSGGKLNVGELAIVLHEKLDDFGQPTGNAGGRIGCGIILITQDS